MKIILTGGVGYIGSHTLVGLLAKGYEIIVIDNLVNSSKIALDRVFKITGKQCTFIHGDIRDYSFLNNVFSNLKPDAVIHFAGLKSVSESVVDPLKYYDVNVNGSIVLLRVMSEFGCKKIIFSSSATVYGQANYLPYDESHPVHPINPYGTSKLFVEKILKDWVSSNDDNRAICLRYFNPVGAHPSGLIGESPNALPNNLMPYLTKVAAGQLEELRIFGDDYDTRDGTGERDFIHVCDLADCHILALERMLEIPNFQVLNVGTGRGVTVYELVETFEKITHCKIPIKVVPRRSGDTARSWADGAQAEKLLGFFCKKNIFEMCEDSWRWHSQNLDGYT